MQKQWYLTQQGALYDLNAVTYISVVHVRNPDQYLVRSDDGYTLGVFDTKQDAYEYIKKIHFFLIA